MFSPYQGRFITLDPIRFSGGTTNLYQAESNNPVNRLDPSGLVEITRSKGEFPTSKGVFVIDMMQFFAGSRGTIAFHPDVEKCQKCTNIRLIQSIRLVTGKGVDHVWRDDRDKIRTTGEEGEGVLSGWQIDFLPGDVGCKPGKPCSPYYRDSVPDDSEDGFLLGGVGYPASLFDAPIGRVGDSYEYETVAICADTGAVLGSLAWGFKVDGPGIKVTFQQPIASDQASPTFKAALENFNRYYKNPTPK